MNPHPQSISSLADSPFFRSKPTLSALRSPGDPHSTLCPVSAFCLSALCFSLSEHRLRTGCALMSGYERPIAVTSVMSGFPRPHKLEKRLPIRVYWCLLVVGLNCYGLEPQKCHVNPARTR